QALANGLVDPEAPYGAYTGFDALGGTLHLSCDQVQAAYRWARAELELHSRRRLRPAGFWARLDHDARTLAKAALTLPARWHGRWQARPRPQTSGTVQHVR